MRVTRSVTGADRPGARGAWLVFGVLAILVLIADQLTKSAVVAGLRFHESHDILGDLLRITLIQNTGALFGLFRDQAALFALVSVAVVGLIVWYQLRTAGTSLLTTLALGLLLGGAIGNFLDRIRYGYVVDFVDAGIGPWRWYTFNVADAAISTAIALLIVQALRPHRLSGEA